MARMADHSELRDCSVSGFSKPTWSSRVHDSRPLAKVLDVQMLPRRTQSPPFAVKCAPDSALRMPELVQSGDSKTCQPLYIARPPCCPAPRLHRSSAARAGFLEEECSPERNSPLPPASAPALPWVMDESVPQITFPSRRHFP